MLKSTTLGEGKPSNDSSRAHPLLIRTSAGKVDGGVSGDSSKPNPVAVVFGWIGSSRRNVKKYEEIYHSLGIDTITISGEEVKVGND